MATKIRKILILLAALVLTTVLLTTAAVAAEDDFDTENFKGLVLTTSVGSDQVWVRLYKGYSTPKDANLLTPVHEEATADGGMAYYYDVPAGKYKCVSRHPTNYTRYYIEKSIYMSAEEVATKTVHDVTTGKRSTSGWDPSSRVYLYTDEVMAQIPSSPDLWPDYADCFTTPAFGSGRNDHAITSQTEMMNFLGGLNGDGDDMYTYILGQSGGRALDIPLVIFTETDLSAAATLEDAAALVKNNGKLTVYYQAQIHGYETASGEGALAMIQRLDGQYGEKLLDKLNIVVIPRLSPYGAYKVQRNVYLESGDIDPNGDFMRLRTVETQLRQKAINLFTPEVGIDAHEFILSHESTSEGRRDILLAAHFLESQTEEFQQQSLNIADTIFDKLDENGLCYQWYDSIVNNVRGSVGSGNAAYRGILHFLVETQGSDSGLTNYERRVVGQVTVATAIMDYAYDNAETLKSVVSQQRQITVNEGKTYEESDQVVLEYGKVLDETLAIPGNKIDLATGELTPTTFSANIWKSIVRARTAPTAYVIPAGESYTEAVLHLMDMQGISYYEIPVGSCVNLQQYKKVTLNSSNKIIEAALTDEQAVAFPQGAYVFSMAQENANILSLLMEPDVTQNTTNTLVQAGTVPIGDDDMIPIYRYIRDLNSEGKIDYAAATQAPEGLEAVGATKIGGTGKITGLDATKAYEYRAETEGSYTAVAEGATEIADLPVGKYYVRFAATADSEASADTLVEVAYTVLEEYTVYLKQSAADDTGDGYTEEMAVQTIATAYAQLDAIMANAPAGTTGKIILLDTYTLPTGRVDFPAHDYPVELSAKVSTNGFSYTGGETADQNVVAFNGDTTLTNIKLMLSASSPSNYISAMGHKFVVDTGVTCERVSSDHHFILCGGDYRGTFASTDVTVRAGYWESIYAGNFASGTITGDVKLVARDTWVRTTIQATYRCTINGNVTMDLENISCSTSSSATKRVYAGPSSSGKIYGSMTVRLGPDMDQTALLACYSNTTVGENASLRVIADGVDLKTFTIYGRSVTSSGVTKYMPATLVLNQGELADVIDTFVAREDATIILGCDQTEAVTLSSSCNLDLNGCDATITVAEGKTLTVCDTATDDFKVLDAQGYGILNATGNAVAKEGYLVREETTGKSYHRKSLELGGVTLRPAIGGIYYTGQFGLNELCRDDVACYGVVLSIKENPELDKEGCEHSTLTTWPQNGAGHGTVLSGIMKKDGGFTANSRNAATKVYGVAYIKYTDGTVEYSDPANFSLRDLVEQSDTMWKGLTQDQKDGLLELYGGFKSVMKFWNIPNIKAA